MRCRQKPGLLFVFVCLMVGGVYLHAYGPMRLVSVVGSTYKYAGSRLYAHTVTKASCNTTCRWLHEQQRRKQHVSSTCNTYRNLTGAGRELSYTLSSDLLETMNHFLVLDSHKLIYCYIPKVGCTNWKRIFLVLSGAIKDTNRASQFETHVSTAKHIRTLAGYSFEEATERLTNYTKFMFVRHPFERLLSGYRDKFLMDYPSSSIFRRNYGQKISTYGGPGHRPLLRPDGTLNVSFAQFVRYVGDADNAFRGDDPTEHWNEMHRMCHPCAVRYDFFGNFSTLHEDADSLLHLEGLDGEVSYPKSTNPTNSSDEAHMARYFASLPPANIKALLTRYAIDFDLFGYTLPSSVEKVLN